MSKSLTSMTKAELIAVIASKDAELLSLRTTVSKYGTPGSRTGEQLRAFLKDAKAEATPSPMTKEHTYESVTEAMTNCKRLAASELNKFWSFTVSGARVICKQRRSI